jgi:hypothetical protein
MVIILSQRCLFKSYLWKNVHDYFWSKGKQAWVRYSEVLGREGLLAQHLTWFQQQVNVRTLPCLAIYLPHVVHVDLLKVDRVSLNPAGFYGQLSNDKCFLRFSSYINSLGCNKGRDNKIVTVAFTSYPSSLCLDYPLHTAVGEVAAEAWGSCSASHVPAFTLSLIFHLPSS